MTVFKLDPTELDRLEASLERNSQDEAPQEFSEEPTDLPSCTAQATMITIFDDIAFSDEDEADQEPEAHNNQNTVVAQLYDVNEAIPLKDFKDNGDEYVQRRVKALAKEMVDLGGVREYSALPEDVGTLATELRARFPNFIHVVNWLEDHLILSTLNRRVYFPPVLLVGPPGVGKTYFSKALAKLLKTSYLEVHFESAQSSSQLSGSSDFWSNSQQGELFNLLVRGKHFNPLVMVDELDKSGGDGRFDPMTSLYQLLERETACSFRDESMRRVALNAAGVMWMLTANDDSSLPSPIISRVTVLRIENPDHEQCKIIARQIYSSILESMVLTENFESALSNEVVSCIAARPPREMKNILITALALAARSGRRFLAPEDISPPVRPGKRIGFVH
jgi:ATP-dependent Lon protease